MKPWSYRPSETHSLSYRARLQNVPHEQDLLQHALRQGSFKLIRFIMRKCFNLTIEGVENLPKEGGYILVSNHSSHLDICSLISALSPLAFKRLHIAAAADVFFTTSLRSVFFSLFFNTFAFDRKEFGHHGLQHCKKILEKGSEILLIFPEGSRSTDGKIKPFKTGIGHLIAECGGTVVPVGLQGCFEAWPRDRMMPRLYPIKMVIGSPLLFTNNSLDKKEITQLIKNEVEKCLRK